MDAILKQRFKAEVTGKGAQDALNRHQVNVNLCTRLSAEMTNLSSTFEQQKNALAKQLQEAERNREQTRLELETANELHEEMKAAAITEEKIGELRSRGVKIPGA